MSGNPRYSGNNFFLFHQNAARVDQKSGVGGERIAICFSFVIQAIGFRSTIEYRFRPASLRITSHLIDLRKVLQAIVHAGEVHAKNVFAFAHIGHSQNLLALQGAVCLDFDRAQLVIRIIKERSAPPPAPADIEAGASTRRRQHDFGNNNEHSPVPMLRRFARAHFDVEQMLLPPLTELETRRLRARGVVRRLILELAPLRARDSSMMRRQRST